MIKRIQVTSSSQHKKLSSKDVLDQRSDEIQDSIASKDQIESLEDNKAQPITLLNQQLEFNQLLHSLIQIIQETSAGRNQNIRALAAYEKQIKGYNKDKKVCHDAT